VTEKRFPHRAFVEQYGETEDGKRRLIAVYEHAFGSTIYREDITVDAKADDVAMLAAISSAWTMMLTKALGVR